MEAPPNGLFILENPLKLDDLGYPHDLGNIHLAIVIYKVNARSIHFQFRLAIAVPLQCLNALLACIAPASSLLCPEKVSELS